MKKFTLSSSVSELPGIGTTRQKQLARLGIFTLKDLVYLFPRAYERRGNVKLLSKVDPGINESVILTVASEVKSAAIRKGLTISKFRAFDESGACEITFFNSPYIKDIFHIGAEFRFYGKPIYAKNKIQFTNPKFEPVLPGIPLPYLVPVYSLTDGISSNMIDKITKIALDEVLHEIKDPLPDDIRLEHSLPVLSYALKNVHFPENEKALSAALSRLAFDELFTFGIGISLSSQHKKIGEGAQFSPCDLSPVTNLLPYELTDSQKKSVNDIYRDTVIKGNDGKIHPMARILVGDVGSGKTVCAIMAMYIAVKSGYQTALMAPTEILAHQHFNDVSELMKRLGIKTELLLGATTTKEKKRIYTSVETGEAQIVIGTHSLLSDKLNFSNLGLVVTDEQHRFGVAQRATLKDKSKAAHLLVMSATPIPRTLALTMYGDLDVSRITEMPKGRTKVDTFVVNESYRTRLNDFILKQAQNGGQCYIVCPSIDAKEDALDLYELQSLNPDSLLLKHESNLKNAVEYAENLRQTLPNLTIACLHGRLKSNEKDKIMTDFSEGKINVLVSTTVIEVGVNVPNATLMIIENADRFGLAQLHQLRGRVGRGNRKSYCVLVSDQTSETARGRLEIMRTTYDGYEIAEKDLILRGPGDFFATVSQDSMRQSGGFEFKHAKLCDNVELMEAAFSAAKKLTDADPALILPEHEEIRRAISEIIAPISSTIS